VLPSTVPLARTVEPKSGRDDNGNVPSPTTTIKPGVMLIGGQGTLRTGEPFDTSRPFELDRAGAVGEVICALSPQWWDLVFAITMPILNIASDDSFALVKGPK
jgi:hypothetical protein